MDRRGRNFVLKFHGPEGKEFWLGIGEGGGVVPYHSVIQLERAISLVERLRVGVELAARTDVRFGGETRERFTGGHSIGTLLFGVPELAASERINTTLYCT
jgi:hypothetical protein